MDAKMRCCLFLYSQRLGVYFADKLASKRMSIRSIHLGKLLRLFYCSDRDRRRLLREDIREQLRREAGISKDGGGDFYVPFWSDAKDHVLGESDLSTNVAIRIAANRGRRRLYPEFEQGFLGWWNGTRRWRNEPIRPIDSPARARLPIRGTDGVVKVENVLALDSGPEFQRLIYPYLVEEPPLTDEGARIALWVMQAALPEYELDDMRILDVLRSHSLGTLDLPLQGDEEHILVERYAWLRREWDRLREEFR